MLGNLMGSRLEDISVSTDPYNAQCISRILASDVKQRPLPEQNISSSKHKESSKFVVLMFIWTIIAIVVGMLSGSGLY